MRTVESVGATFATCASTWRSDAAEPDDLFEHRGAVDVFAQREILALRALFGSLAIIDVGARRVPAQRLTVLIPHRVVLYEEPPVLAIMAPSALLELEGHATREGVPALLPQARHVFRMKKRARGNRLRSSPRS